ncbi:enoyl-CoA hydratase/isomerase family protein [Amycolatopsis sp. K13G38]|uniref:Enoyl-CoA hydratase/isomerase family protein n=1 Tax=Amycolatopsis acididurans TaxID=2724524 RepID=A0ABX1JBV5_9PSEU|nr:enoyl-CoA hydratase-related protein [Amycolatopsis acididurans]NKQ56959.1 enoyl-CoA hydratase/isomerase family protein [Amycolatopsis acididurans]
MTTIEVREVLVRRRGAALWLRLNRPDTLNGLNQAILDGLNAGLDEAESDPGVRTVVITAEGRAFCAGADLRYVRTLNSSPAPDGAYSAGQLFLRRVAPLLNRIESFPKPVLAAVNGLAIGGGLELLLCCDFAIAAESARIGDGHAVYGQIPGGGASVRLTRRLGLARAKQLMFTGELHPAAHFRGTDLITEVVADDELDEHVQRIADVIAQRSPVGVARMKALANDGLEVPLPVGVRMELEASALHEKSEDWREGITAFAEKRAPEFRGR